MNFLGISFMMSFIFLATMLMLVVWIWALVDCLKSKKETTDKLVWVIVIIFLNVIGALLYFFLNEKIKMSGKNKKRLERSKTDRVFAGVCGGIAKYLDIDPTIIRLIWVVFTVFSVGTGLLLYLIGIIIIPDEKNSLSKTKEKIKTELNHKNQDEKKSGSNVLVIAIISVLIVLVILILSATAILLFGINQYKSDGVSVSKQIVSEKVERAFPEVIAYNYVNENENFKNYLSSNLKCNYVKQVNCDGSGDFHSIGIDGDRCFDVQCKFDSKLPDTKGFIVYLSVENDEVKDIIFEKIGETKEIKTYEDCVNAGYEVLYPDILGGPMQCAIGDSYVNITSSQESMCVDMCGDGSCQEIVCTGQGCPCAETRVTCPEDCY
jgi:phage shock protein C